MTTRTEDARRFYGMNWPSSYGTGNTPRERLPILFVALLAWLGTASCVGSRPGRSDGFAEQSAQARAQGVAALAPDLYFRAERAHQAALEARARGDWREAADQSALARRLLSAAGAEAERIQLERRRVLAEQTAARARAEQVRYRRERQRIEQETALYQSAQREQQLARQSFLELQRAEPSTEPRSRERRPAGERWGDFGLRRSRLVLAAAVAMQADQRSVSAAEKAVKRAEDASGNDSEFAVQAGRALGAAADALGAARVRNPAPAPEEIAALLAAGRELGFAVERIEGGARVTLPGLFEGSSSHLTSGGKSRMRLLSWLARAHKRGVIRVEVPVGSASASLRRRLGRERGQRIVSELVKNAVDRSRFQLQESPLEDASAGSVDFFFMAYGLSAVVDQK